MEGRGGVSRCCRLQLAGSKVSRRAEAMWGLNARSRVLARLDDVMTSDAGLDYGGFVISQCASSPGGWCAVVVGHGQGLWLLYLSFRCAPFLMGSKARSFNSRANMLTAGRSGSGVRDMDPPKLKYSCSVEAENRDRKLLPCDQLNTQNENPTLPCCQSEHYPMPTSAEQCRRNKPAVV